MIAILIPLVGAIVFALLQYCGLGGWRGQGRNFVEAGLHLVYYHSDFPFQV